ncbi:hypothetical protein [Hungatella hathewayi]|uniref:hypothetical protein n=1 Tax=Hungatella hathewayi TaxID=154046 RepID=UPI003565D2A0
MKRKTIIASIGLATALVGLVTTIMSCHPSSPFINIENKFTANGGNSAQSDTSDSSTEESTSEIDLIESLSADIESLNAKVNDLNAKKSKADNDYKEMSQVAYEVSQKNEELLKMNTENKNIIESLNAEIENLKTNKGDEIEESSNESNNKVYITDLDYFTKDGTIVPIPGTIKDNTGQTHENVLGASKNFWSYTYLVNKQYKLLHGVAFLEYSYRDTFDSCNVKVYVDGTVAKQYTIKAGTKPQTISIDVSNADEVTIRLGSYNKVFLSDVYFEP